MQALSQLSYSPVSRTGRILRAKPKGVNRNLRKTATYLKQSLKLEAVSRKLIGVAANRGARLEPRAAFAFADPYTVGS